MQGSMRAVGTTKVQRIHASPGRKARRRGEPGGNAGPSTIEELEGGMS